ncbi:hypothetical protein HanPI659440_Chr02g0040311 [Helianthus annuus]|uniref:Uncharacterized protein n=1 Tax=Helianthus annuus TaxID=4232 RepID=A0A9K3NYS8_HELAN|nr:hypothetical protein HanXRQr2_Chr02g0053751 [Helianthus annuus]KAJ0776436.1 hypothetical protein HanLR1_Chr02g0045581 [Helianthus annuus]KAJ0804633.1 hypothetical protein HanPI659440_Chr02g0040311 [Helianthus annuus]
MWFHMATVSMQPWRIHPFCLIVYKSEPHNRFITSTTEYTSVLFLVLVLSMVPALNAQKRYDCRLVLT